MARRVNIFGQPLAYDVGVEYVNGQPQQRKRPINLDRDDVSSATKETVVKYVADLTHGVEGNKSNANQFPIEQQPTVVVSVTTTDGSSAPLTQNTNPVLIENNTRAGRILDSYSDSSQAAISKDEPLLDTHGDATFVKKGKSARTGGTVDGNRLLSDMEGNPHPDVVTKYVSPILSNNRFSPERKMSSIDGHDKKFNPDHPEEGYGSYKRHRRLGVDMTDAQIANVGPMLTLRATKELDSISREGYGAKGPEGSGAKAASLLPGLAQVGIARVSTDDLEVDSVLRALIAGETEGGNINDGESGPRTVLSMNTSYGQMNNVLEKFSGLLPLGMVAAGAALSIALSIAMKAILAIFLLITNASSANSQKRDSIGRFIPGDSRYNPAFSKITFPPIPLPAKLFGLVECVNPYGDAVTEGIKVFFGGSIGGSLARVLESPGFYVVFCRNVVRSAADLARGLEDVGKGSPIAIAENIIGFIDVIKSSKVVAVMNMFAQIGDVSLQQAVRLARFDAGEERTSDSEIDNIEGLNAMRNRKPGSLALAWGAATTPSTLILPRNTARAMMGGRPGLLTAMLANGSGIEYSNQRLTPEQVTKVEDVLNAEYVPFYFQDLRTNEFVSFHAFLGNLTENYTANYDSIEGYGRVDAVKMYRSTARKISVQFTIAATNADDFDAMWLKINKLTTLVYPQWSKGTLLNDGQGNHFVQPFSQIPSASPLMRVRVGDLWTSNYSKFSLARVFGLGNDSTFKLKTFTHNEDGKVDEKIEAIKTVVDAIRFNAGELKVGSEWLLEPGDYEASTKDQGALGAALGALASAVGAGASNPRVTIKLRVPTAVVVSQAVNSDAYAVEIVDKEGLPKHVASAKFLVSRSHLSITARTLFTYGVREAFLDEDPLSDEQATDKTMSLANFFSSENNALVKAYESSKGRGLAAFVESMDFDWFDGGNVMWETGVAGSRAPKMCKVTLNMSVVHDIAPGMDADGFNRAPVYNVGGPSNAMAGRKPDDQGKEVQTSARKVRKSLL